MDICTVIYPLYHSLSMYTGSVPDRYNIDSYIHIHLKFIFIGIPKNATDFLHKQVVNGFGHVLGFSWNFLLMCNMYGSCTSNII